MSERLNKGSVELVEDQTEVHESVLAKTVRALSVGTAVTVMGDVAKSKDIERMVRIVLEFGCRLDVLSNNCSLIK